MRIIKFRYRLRLISNHWGGHKEGDIVTFYMNLNNDSNGLAKFSIDERWQIVTCDEWTGLKDKNEIDIYEGDILESEDRIVKITWHEQAGQWDSDFIKYTKDPCTNGLSNYDFKYKAEVIGNIHENPELINY